MMYVIISFSKVDYSFCLSLKDYKAWQDVKFNEWNVFPGPDNGIFQSQGSSKEYPNSIIVFMMIRNKSWARTYSWTKV